MEVNDWTPSGKDSFTTPGGAFAPPPEGAAKTYAYDRSAVPVGGTVRPAQRPQGAPAGGETSPFARGADTAQPWYAGVAETGSSVQPQAAYKAPAEERAAAVVLSHDGEAQTAIPIQTAPGGPQVYTIQLPAQPRQPAPKQRSLWWVPLVVIAALLIGMALGFLAYPMVMDTVEPTAAPSVPSGSNETAAARVYRENVDTVVNIVVGPSASDSTGTSSAATGFLITEDGYLLTNAHVVKNRGDVTVILSDGRQLPAQIIAMEEAASDIALLRIEATALQTVILGDSDTLRVGDPVFTIGNPLGELSNSLSAGWLSAEPREINTGSATYTMLQTNAAINKGNSGGPLFDAAGRVVGVVTAKISAATGDNTVEGLGFALPINDVMEIVTPWLSAARGG